MDGMENAEVLSREKTPHNDAMLIDGIGGRSKRKEMEEEKRSDIGEGDAGSAGFSERDLERLERDREKMERQDAEGMDRENEWLAIYLDRISTAKTKARSEIRLNQWAQYR